MKKRILSILIALAMVLSLIPGVAFAGEQDVAQIGETPYETLQAAVNAAATDGSTTNIVMLANTEEATITIPTNTKIVLDLAGKTITGQLNINQVVSDLTINDTDGSGGITNTSDHVINVKTTNATNGGKVNLTINGGNFNCTKNSQGSGALYVWAANATTNNESSITINGGTFSSNFYSAFLTANANDSAALNLSITGGTFVGDATCSYGTNAAVNLNKYVGTANISGGTFTEMGSSGPGLKYEGKVANTNKLTVSSGTFNGQTGISNVFF